MNESLTTLNQTLETPDVKAEDVITNDQFQLGLRTEYKPLLEFLKKDSTIINLSKWCFDPTLLADPDFNKYSKIIIQLFTSSIPSVFQIFVENLTFAKVIHDFLTSDAAKYPLFCGFLNRILSQQIRWGEPTLFKEYLDIGVLLIKNIRNIAIQDLMVTIATRDNIKMFQEMNLILILSEIMISEMNESCASTIQQIYDNISDDSPLIDQFRNTQVIQNIIDFCLSSQSIVLTSDLLDVAIHIVENNMDLLPILEKKKKTFQIRKGNITPISVLMIPLFTQDINQLFTLFFEPEACQYLHQYCAMIIPDLKPEEIISIAKIPRLIDNVIDIFGTDKWCHHMTQIVIVFARILPIYGNLTSKKWDNFMNTSVYEMLRILEEPYGGDIPADDSYMSDDDDPSFEEEEEEEEDESSESESESESENESESESESESDDDDDEKNGSSGSSESSSEDKDKNDCFKGELDLSEEEEEKQ
ncbi:hypothetical protein TRFO_15977 [Tritrichomonas foetus]|uniref:Uncharacterized protein n=1 Tax=Tritrichomonas foetus TaxID=1144522 RepID=A0A1J4KW71_9EUKA|nr:hypothetical protein TRFO_15977 [Tritrichomonas foetus]|eukprot:OHT13765.1 hypothetical protein TRFO_15977 [Tritrichomonas foetus]